MWSPVFSLTLTEAINGMEFAEQGCAWAKISYLQFSCNSDADAQTELSTE